MLEHVAPSTIRLSIFFSMLVIMAAWESLAPRRRPHPLRGTRVSRNLILVALNSGLLRLTLPIGLVAYTAWLQSKGWGLFNLVDLPAAVEVIATLLALDLLIYAQHVAFHLVPVLWRLHYVHHADPGIDFSTGLRFHPIEILLSMAIKFGAVTLLGPSPVAVLTFEIFLNAGAVFNHSNVALPPWIDRWLRLIFVTPDMHRVHHSVVVGETNSNYGFNLPWWDRLFGTYIAQPAAGHDQMHIGLAEYQDQPAVTTLSWMLKAPFQAPLGRD